MKPNQVAASLTRIATKLQNSKWPDRSLITTELEGLVHKIAVGEVSRFSKKIFRLVSELGVSPLTKVTDAFIDTNNLSVTASVNDALDAVQENPGKEVWLAEDDGVLFIFFGSEQEIVDKLEVAKITES